MSQFQFHCQRRERQRRYQPTVIIKILAKVLGLVSSRRLSATLQLCNYVLRTPYEVHMSKVLGKVW